jgi:hypothetical protein
MSVYQNKKVLDHRLRWDWRPTGLPMILAITTIAGLLMVPGGRGLAQAGKAQGAQEAKLGLGDLIKQANQSVVLINIENKSGPKVGFGSGFLIDDKGLVATNLHVVRQAAKARVIFEFKDGNTAGVKCLRAYDKKRDLAILELDKPPPAAKPLPLGPPRPWPGRQNQSTRRRPDRNQPELQGNANRIDRSPRFFGLMSSTSSGVVACKRLATSPASRKVRRALAPGACLNGGNHHAS